MKIKGRIGIIFMAAAMIAGGCLALTACGGGGTFTVITPDGAPYAAIVQMRHEVTELGGNKLDYTVEAETGLRAAMVNGSADFIITPTNVGASVHAAYANGDDVTDYKLAASISWGVLYMVTTDTSLAARGECESLDAFLAQFNGKTIETIGETAIPGKSVSYLFGASGAGIAGVSAATEIVAKVNQGKDVIGVLGEPVVTNIRAKSKVLCSISDIYAEVTGKGFPMASLFVKADIIEKHAGTVADFLTALEVSADYFNAGSENATQVGVWAEEFGDSSALKSATLAAAAQHMNVGYKNAQDAKEDVRALLTNAGMAGLALDSLFM